MAVFDVTLGISDLVRTVNRCWLWNRRDSRSITVTIPVSLSDHKNLGMKNEHSSLLN